MPKLRGCMPSFDACRRWQVQQQQKQQRGILSIRYEEMDGKGVVTDGMLMEEQEEKEVEEGG